MTTTGERIVSKAKPIPLEARSRAQLLDTLLGAEIVPPPRHVPDADAAQRIVDAFLPLGRPTGAERVLSAYPRAGCGCQLCAGLTAGAPLLPPGSPQYDEVVETHDVPDPLIASPAPKAPPAIGTGAFSSFHRLRGDGAARCTSNGTVRLGHGAHAPALILDDAERILRSGTSQTPARSANPVAE